MKPEALQADLSVIVPVFNEADNVVPLATEILMVLAKQPTPFVLVFVDDASTDSTWNQIAEAQKMDSRIRGLRHARNAGQSAALWTGIRESRSPLLATMDGDRQNDPADFLTMLEELSKVDFVSGRRAKREDGWLRRVSSRIARAARRTVLGVDFADTGCAMRVFKREVLEGIFGFNGLHRFLPVLVHGGGFKTLEVPVNHRPRVAGVSKYGVWNRLGRGIVDLFAIRWYQRRRLAPQPRLDRL
ncbi:MAG: glycosyltransferase family 2 protein [Verrucomicrobiales bacterium]|nr:glycosyltransferase family 2 protein [Verrucomicrobiales bacterium]